MPTRQIRSALIVLAVLAIGLLCASAQGAVRRGLSCPSGGCSVALAPVRKETPQLQRPTVRTHKHVQNVTRYRRGKLKVWRVWRVPRRFRRPLFWALAPH